MIRGFLEWLGSTGWSIRLLESFWVWPLVEVGQRANEAADARSLDAVFDMGAEMYYVCTNCHGTYAAETLRPNDTRVN